MSYRIVIGAMLLTLSMETTDYCMAAGAVAVGQPADIAKDGVSIFTYVDALTTEIAKEKALAGCKGTRASATARSLCKIVATFQNQCVAQAIDPDDGTPGFGWAMAPNSQEAKRQALANCRDTAGPTRQNACVVDRQSLWCDGSAK